MADSAASVLIDSGSFTNGGGHATQPADEWIESGEKAPSSVLAPSSKARSP